ncbi:MULTISPECIES: alpha/beta fold hydrolase [Mycobacterium]|uniref:Epoxide hydrolase n=1 Tax=Mycobacterium kiyosense TaxID=2871094 RepID=A0A9P3QAR1_9MYCO|nr:MULTISPECIES: alpha/beta hydrolase [Mycobacterium]BDB41938.1 epoxide hydrolase [Mycobacterium kiyosense]BDE14777.1 epoxide hydrolase [Mycobacterium sp. 20KCMC460]GLB84233.1 epoxide hydrolase [Mycobacterium kiyosense]GLB91724.1 epoxide hydrolase [Mycobacterium kiyosense]GLB96759.1 epoxide hydrolase [Mycobacterium kiyosense]
MARPEPLTFGDIHDTAKPLAVAVHGFPDTPHTWRHLGPALADLGYRVVAPWLPGYDAPASGPISVGTYVRHILSVRSSRGGDERSVLIGHDWGAHTGYGTVGFQPDAFRRLVTLAVPPSAALGETMLGYRQLKRSFYIWLIQQVGLAETALTQPGFWEQLWADWSPGYDPQQDISWLREHVTAENIASVIAPYRATFNPAFADPDAEAEAMATFTPPPIPTLYLHGSQDGGLGAEVVAGAARHLPVPGSAFEMIDGTGHFLHLEQPELVNARICGWLAG